MNIIYYLIHSTSFGDTLAATPTLRYLSKSHGKKINVVTHIKDAFITNPYVKSLLSFEEFYSLNLSNIVKYESFTNAGRKDGNGIEKKFAHIDIRQTHAMDLGFQLLPEDMEYDFFHTEKTENFNLPEKYVVLHVTSNWGNRTWDYQNWYDLVGWLKSNKIFTVLIGKDHQEIVHSSISIEPLVKKCPTFNNLFGIDLTNKIGLNTMFHIINDSHVLITMDTGPMHIAGLTDTHILQIGGAQHPSFRVPYRKGSQSYKHTFVGGGCNIFCNTDLKYNIKEWGDINSVAPLTDCREKKPTFECHPQIDEVINKLKEII
jgi:ADP-heptose:LPS heptosyltransferase